MLANIDKNPSAMWSKMVDNMVPAITKTVTFSKRLPGKPPSYPLSGSRALIYKKKKNI